MEANQVKKINVVYLLGYIFIPIVITALCYLLSFLFFPKGTMAAILFMCPTFLSVLWWIFGGKLIFKQQQKQFERELDAIGFVRNQTFHSRGCDVIVDVKEGKIAMLFFWNPFQRFVIPANRITAVWVDDGKSGKGIMEGSSSVSFLFTVDSTKIRVYTFTSNKRWRMDSDYILKGISKADMMVKILETARQAAH